MGGAKTARTKTFFFHISAEAVNIGITYIGDVLGTFPDYFKKAGAF